MVNPPGYMKQAGCRYTLGNLLRRLLAVSLPCVLLLTTACSPKSLFGGSDNALPDDSQYHPVNRACTGMDLSSPQVTGNELRSLIKCFNSYGALDPIQRLFDKLSDEQVEAFVKMANAHFLDDKTFLYDLERAYEDGRNTGALNSAMDSLSTAFQNPELLSSAISLLASEDGATKQKIIGILQTLAAHLDAPSIEEGISLGMDFTSAKAFVSLQSAFGSDKKGISDLKTLSDNYYGYLEMSEKPGNISLIDEISRDMQSGDVFTVLDGVLGTTPQQIAADAPILAPIMPAMTGNDGEILSGISQLFSGLQTPIQCLKKTKQVPDPVMHMFSEISHTPDGGGADYIRRTHLLTMVALEPFCTYPPAATADYPELVKLADSPAAYGVERVVKTAFADHHADGTRPGVSLIQKWFLDAKTQQALPILQEVTARGAWPDVILLLGLPNQPERGTLTSTLKILTDPSPFLNGSSIKDALTDILVSAGPDKLFSLASALKSIMNQSDAFAYPILDGLRSNFYTDDAHPYIDFTRKLLADAPAQSQFFTAFFSVAGTPEFKQSLKLISAMAKDGRLREILADTITILHGYSQQGQHPVNVDVALPYSPGRRHDLSIADLNLNSTVKAASTDVCAALSPGMTLDNMSNMTRFNEQWDAFLNCLTSKGNYTDVATEVNHLRSETMPDGENALGFSMDLVRELGAALPTAGVGYLGDVWAKTEDNGSFNHVLNAASTWISKQIIRPLLDMAAPILTRTPDLRSLENFAAMTLQRKDFPALLLEGERLSLMKPDPETEESIPAPDVARIKRWVENKECEELPFNTSARDGVLQVRADQIISDYEQSATSFDSIGGLPRKEWSYDDIQTFVEKGLKKFSDPSQNRPDHTLVDSLIAFLGYYSLPKGQQPNSQQHFNSDYFAQWFFDRSNDRRPISLYHLGDPPDAMPHVHYVDGLDRLELVVLNADFDFESSLLEKLGIKIGMNLGKKALADIGDSWGDEPEEIWPDDIKAKYADSRPPTIRETIEDLGNTLEWLKVGIGFPKQPNCEQTADPNDPIALQEAETSNNGPICRPIPGIQGLPSIPGCLNMPDMPLFDLRNIKRRVYNLAQVYDVLMENLPDSGFPQAGGMKVLRDFFYQLNRSTPSYNQGQVDGFKNNLSIVAWVAGSGLDRQLAFDLRHSDLKLVQQFFGGIVALSQAPAAKPLLQSLLADDPDHQLIWSIGKGLYPNMGNPFPPSGPRLDALRMKQSLYYGVAALNQLGLFGSLDEALSPLLQGPNLSYLIEHGTDAVTGLSSVQTSRLARALYIDKLGPGKKAIGSFIDSALKDSELPSAALSMARLFDENPQAGQSLDEFKTRWKAFAASPTAKTVQTSQFERAVLDFFEERTKDRRGAETERAVRAYLATRLQSGDADQILDTIAKDPAQFESGLDLFSKYIKNGDLTGFFAYLRRTVNTIN